MNARLRVVLTFCIFFCLLLVWIAPAATTVKTLYLDGNLIASDSNSTTGLQSFGSHITIGAAGDLTFIYNQYIGAIDEFAIYGEILDADAIQAHYDARNSDAAYIAAVDANNPLLWLRFEDSDANDGMIATNSGSLTTNVYSKYIHTGADPLSIVEGISGAGSSSVYFTSTAEDGEGVCVDVNDPDEQLGNLLDGDLTAEIWVNFVDLDNPSEAANAYPRFFQRKGSYGLYTNNDPNTLGIFGGDSTDYIDLPYDINDNQWHHIVVTFDSNYGEEELPDTDSYVEEVAADNPVAWLRFEDELPEDSSGNDIWVSYGSAITIREKTGGIGKTVYFDKSEGSGVYGVALSTVSDGPPQDANEDIGYQVYGDEYAFAPNDITFEMWYRLPSSQNQFAIFFQQLGRWNNEPNGPGVSNQGGNIRVFCGAEAWEPGVSSYLDAQWHHLVVTYDEEYLGQPQTMNVQLFIDGYKKSEETFTGPNAKLGTELSHILIGAENDIGYTYNPLFRHADEFAIYEGVLSAERILYHYAAWQAKTCEELVSRGGLPTWTKTDRDGNCVVGLADFAFFAQEWALCNDPAGGTGCGGNW